MGLFGGVIIHGEKFLFFLGFFGNFFKHILLTSGEVFPISGDGSFVGEDTLVGLFGVGGSPVVKISHFFLDFLGHYLHILLTNGGCFVNLW